MMPGGSARARGQASYLFHCDHAPPSVLSSPEILQLAPVRPEGFKVSVYTPPAQAKTANAYATSLAHMIWLFSPIFRPARRTIPR